jgi:hypothetical protein
MQRERSDWSLPADRTRPVFQPQSGLHSCVGRAPFCIYGILYSAIYSVYFVCTVIGKQGRKKKKVTPEVLLFKKIKISLHSHTWKKTIKISPF